jgi:WD40 repeat protein
MCLPSRLLTGGVTEMASTYVADTGRNMRASGEPGGSRSLESLRVWSGSLLGRLAGILLLAASISGCASLGSSPTVSGKPIPTKNPAPTSLRINLTADGLYCATHIAWSPDSSLIALVGNAGNCSGAGPGRTPGLLNIYSVATGKVIQKLLLDTTVLALPLWSPDGSHVLVAEGLYGTITIWRASSLVGLG